MHSQQSDTIEVSGTIAQGVLVTSEVWTNPLEFYEWISTGRIGRLTLSSNAVSRFTIVRGYFWVVLLQCTIGSGTISVQGQGSGSTGSTSYRVGHMLSLATWIGHMLSLAT